MQSLMEMLYTYAQENKASTYLQTAEYRRAVSGMELGWEAFRATLTAEQGERLNALLSQEAEITRIEDEASFCSALPIGVTLGRL